MRTLMDEAVAEAKAGPDPATGDVLADVYVKY